MVGCLAYALNSGAELYASCCPSSDLGHASSGLGHPPSGSGGLGNATELGNGAALLGLAGARAGLPGALLGLGPAFVPEAALCDGQSCASLPSLILWCDLASDTCMCTARALRVHCSMTPAHTLRVLPSRCDFVSALLFVFGCGVLLYSAYPEQLLQADPPLPLPTPHHTPHTTRHSPHTTHHTSLATHHTLLVPRPSSPPLFSKLPTSSPLHLISPPIILYLLHLTP